MNGQPVVDVASLRNAVAIIKPGSKIALAVLRNGKTINVEVEVGNFPTSKVAAGSAKNQTLGIDVENLTPELAKKLNLSSDLKGVVVSSIQTNSPLVWAGVRKGALILEVNKKPVETVDEFNKALDSAEKGKPLLFLIKQGETTRYISFKAG